MKVQGIDFKWARMHIDSILISDVAKIGTKEECWDYCLLYTSPSPRDRTRSRMPSSA